MTKTEKENTAVRTAIFSILSNGLLAICKWLTGYFGNSYALIADAIESTADVFSSALVLLGIKYSNKPADSDHPYGHGRAEALITFAVVGFLVISAIVIILGSVQNILTPHEMPKPFTLFVLAAIIIWKEASYRQVIKKANQTNSTSLKADAWHHRSDAITSVAAFIGISFALIMGKGYEAADDCVAILAAFIILYNSYKIAKPAWGELMDEDMHQEVVEELRVLATEVEGVLDTEKCYIRKAGMAYYVDLHIIVDGSMTVKEGHSIAHRLKDKLIAKMPSIADVLIHVEPRREDVDCK